MKVAQPLHNEHVRMLFVGDDWYGSNATSLRNGFLQQGVDVTTINTFQLASPRAHLGRRGAKKISLQRYDEVATARVSKAINSTLRSSPPFDIMFVFKGDFVTAETVSSFSGLKVHYHPDDSANSENTSSYYRAAEVEYDFHVTTKLHNIEELKARTGSRIVFVRCAYDPAWHSPQSFASSSRVGLIGTRRPDRTHFIEECARSTREKMLIAGSGWRRESSLARLAEVRGPQFGLDFSRYAARAPIQLGVLNSANRDTHTCRTYEIPAVGALFLGEWTPEHEEIFSAPNSALLYHSPEEALEMISFAEANPIFVDRARRRGFSLIVNGQHTYRDRAGYLLRQFSELL